MCVIRFRVSGAYRPIYVYKYIGPIPACIYQGVVPVIDLGRQTKTERGREGTEYGRKRREDMRERERGRARKRERERRERETDRQTDNLMRPLYRYSPY